MLQKKWWVVALSLVFVLSSVLFVGAAGERVTIKTTDGYVQETFNVTDADVVIWEVTNTSQTKDLYFSISGWWEVIKPGETFSGSLLGKDLNSSRLVSVSLSGASGEAEIQVK